jgi:hypothetical protein
LPSSARRASIAAIPAAAASSESQTITLRQTLAALAIDQREARQALGVLKRRQDLLLDVLDAGLHLVR